MRKIDFLVVHCTATLQNASIESIKKHWQSLGWQTYGYHFIIEKDGKINSLLDIEKVSNGVFGNNSNSINIAYIGGVDIAQKPIDNRTKEQKQSFATLLQELKNKFPKAEILGHRDFIGVKKACPCFSAKEEYKLIKPV